MAQVDAVNRTAVGKPFSGAHTIFDSRNFAVRDLKKSLETRCGRLSAGVKALLLQAAIWAVNNLLPFTQRFIIKTRVTFGLTNGFGIVRHDMLANMFGNGRELFGLKRIPDFAKDAGKVYLLKTRDAFYRHYADFSFGDMLRTVIDVVEVRKYSFKVRVRFINEKTGQVGVVGYQTIAYTNMLGELTPLPSWLKVILALTCRHDVKNEKVRKLDNGNLVCQHKNIVTSDMVNAEKNVSHDIYAKLLTQKIELFLLGRVNRRICAFKVREGFYRYGRDFYAGDSISAKLYLVDIDKTAAIFRAEFCNTAGDVHTKGWQKIVFTDDTGKSQNIPQELVDVIKPVRNE